MAFELPPLPYAYDALEPTIDKETMTLHHDKHHKAYTDKLNEAIGEDPSLEGKGIDDLMKSMSGAPAKLRNNGGGYWNHDFFWKSMKNGGSQPSGALKDAIEAKFGSVDAMKEKFNDAGVAQFGSGWVWLIAGEDGELAITSTPNQDNPLMDVAATKGTPILGNDVWEEHAYYITYRNVRPDYLKAWWNVVDWEVAGQRYDAAK